MVVQFDLVVFGWMQGVLLLEDKCICYMDEDYFVFFKLCWMVCYFCQLMFIVGVSCGEGVVCLMMCCFDSVLDVVIFILLGVIVLMCWVDVLDVIYIDGIVVLYDGVVVYECYSGCLDVEGQYGVMFVIKLMIGLFGEILVVDGILDENVCVDVIVFELYGSGFGDVMVKQILEMIIGLCYSEDYVDFDVDVWQYVVVGSILLYLLGYCGFISYYDYL